MRSNALMGIQKLFVGWKASNNIVNPHIIFASVKLIITGFYKPLIRRDIDQQSPFAGCGRRRTRTTTRQFDRFKVRGDFL